MKIKIVGSGFSGLSLAFLLQQEGFEVEIFEKNSHSGGLIQTTQTPNKIIESAANGFLANSNVLNLFKQLDIKYITPLKTSKKRYIYHHNRPARWPFSPLGTLRTVFGAGKLLWDKEKATPHKFETIANWSHRIFGNEFTNNTLAPGLNGIYAGDIEKMSASLIFSKYFHKKQKKAKPEVKGLISCPNGMGEIIAKMRQRVLQQGGVIHYNSDFSLDDSNTVPVVIATSLEDAKSILNDNVCNTFKELETLNLCSTTLHYSSPAPIDGFGVLFPKNCNVKALGVLMSSNIFEGRCQSGHTETWIMGGTKQKDIITLTDEEILSVIEEDRKSLFANFERPVEFKIHRWPRALPHYTLQLEELLNEGIALPENVFLTGNYLGQIGLSGILDYNHQLTQKLKDQYLHEKS